MTRIWTKVVAPDGSDDAFRVAIAPEFHPGDGLLLATPCADLEEATRFAGLVDGFMERMVADYSEQEVEFLPDGDPHWAMVYLDWDWYLRLQPGHMDMEAAGYGHGLALAGNYRKKADAEAAIPSVVAEMDRILAGLVATLPDGHPLAAVAARLDRDSDPRSHADN